MPAPPSEPMFDEARAAAYDEKIRLVMPGYDALMAAVSGLLAPVLPPAPHLLIAGAGTGAEILALGRLHPDWRFTAIDPSDYMLAQCRAKTEAAGWQDRVACVCGYVDDVPEGAMFDAATSIFVAHFLHDPGERHRYFSSIAKRLRNEAPFVVADLHRPSPETAFPLLFQAWRTRYAAAGIPAETVEKDFAIIAERVHFAIHDELTSTFGDAGLTEPTRFYQWLLWGAWYARKAG